MSDDCTHRTVVRSEEGHWFCEACEIPFVPARNPDLRTEEPLPEPFAYAYVGHGHTVFQVERNEKTPVGMAEVTLFAQSQVDAYAKAEFRNGVVTGLEVSARAAFKMEHEGLLENLRNTGRVKE